MRRRAVEWLSSAEDDLASIWLRLPNDAITIATYDIDKDVADDAETNGVALSEGLFVINRGPLRAIFEIGDSNIVRIVSVSLLREWIDETNS
jgi:hypothetical protein